MQLHSGAPYWLVRSGLGTDGSMTLGADERCDVVVIGAGITGALVSDELAGRGMDVVVLDKREPGLGSTAASSALLLYETDAELSELVRTFGERDAARVYELGREAIETLGDVAESLGGDCDFSKAHAIYLCSRRRDAKRVREEANLRRRLGFEVEWVDGAELERAHGLHARGALRSPGAGRVDPLKLTRQLLARAQRNGARVYRETDVTTYDTGTKGVSLRTADGRVIRAGRLVFAAGYETPELFPAKLVNLDSTFALVTERESGAGDPLDGVVAWESARPYLYLRSTPDGRVMIGGRDAPFKSAALRDRLLPSRIPQLERRLREVLPGVERETAFSWSGTFGETRDSLPYIGPVPGVPCTLFALGYGGNGITFSAIATRIIADACTGRRNDDARIFRVDR